MNPDTQLLLAEIQKIAADQSNIQKQLSDQRDLLEHRFHEADASLEKWFEEDDATVERRIIDSELRQDSRLTVIEKAASDFVLWRQETEGVMDDLRLKVNKLDKHWDCSVIEQTISLYQA